MKIDEQHTIVDAATLEMEGAADTTEIQARIDAALAEIEKLNTKQFQKSKEDLAKADTALQKLYDSQAKR